jgi:hypothetical protein
MAVARVVSFDGVDSGRIADIKSQIESGEPPEGMNPTEMLMLHDPDGGRALAIVMFENDEEYRKGDEVLSAMPADDVPGQRTGVDKYDVAVHVKR